MSEHPPTLLIVYLCPAQNEDALSHLDEALTVAGIEYRLIAQQEERVSLESAAPFVYHAHGKAYGLRVAIAT